MKKQGSLIAFIVAFSLVWAAVLALNLVPELRGDFGWRWPYALPLDWPRLLPLLAGLAAYLAGAFRLMRARRTVWLMAWAVLACVGLTLASASVSSSPASPLFKLYSVAVSPGVGGWHYAAARIDDLGQTLRQWPAYMQSASRFSTHLGIVPPGAVLVYYVLDQVLSGLPALAAALATPLRAAQCQNYEIAWLGNAQLASAWAGILMPLWGALTVFPLHRIGARLYGEREARWAVAWWPLIPSFLMFTGSLNTFFPLLAAGVVLCLVEGLCRGSRAWVVAAGLLLSAATFISFAFLPLIFMAGMIVLLSFLFKTDLSAATPAPSARGAWRWPVITGLWFGLGLFSVWVVYYLLTGVTFPDVFRTASLAHLAMDRPYLPWLFLHLYDYFIFTGWPLVLLALVGVWVALRTVINRQQVTNGGVLALSVSATLIALDLSGTMRGESGRILLFLTPFLLLVAAGALGSSSLATLSHAGWVVTCGQVLVAATMIATLRVIDAEFSTEPPITAPALTQSSPDTFFPSGAAFAGALHLDSFAGHVESRSGAGDTVTPTLVMWLDWHATGPVSVPYYLSLIPVAPGGQTGAATLSQPFDQQFPITCWLPRRGAIHERIELPLQGVAQEAQEGGWWVSLSLMDRQGRTADVLLPSGEHGTQVGLGAFFMAPGTAAGTAVR